MGRIVEEALEGKVVEGGWRYLVHKQGGPSVIQVVECLCVATICL